LADPNDLGCVPGDERWIFVSTVSLFGFAVGEVGLGFIR
jgi:hypothetical protein